MAKKNTAFVCTECGADTPRWSGQCSACQEWNTIKEVLPLAFEFYGARWKIEAGFKELKQDMGSQKSHGKSYNTLLQRKRDSISKRSPIT
jgi:predicted ATP-dependent serine protease